MMITAIITNITDGLTQQNIDLVEILWAAMQVAFILVFFMILSKFNRDYIIVSFYYF